MVNGASTTVRTEKRAPWAWISKEMFEVFATVDLHDRYRQGTLHLEATWKTKTWWERVFGTALGIICTNSYFGYRLEYKHFNHNRLDGADEFEAF